MSRICVCRGSCHDHQASLSLAVLHGFLCDEHAFSDKHLGSYISFWFLDTFSFSWLVRVLVGVTPSYFVYDCTAQIHRIDKYHYWVLLGSGQWHSSVFIFLQFLQTDTPTTMLNARRPPGQRAAGSQERTFTRRRPRVIC